MASIVSVDSSYLDDSLSDFCSVDFEDLGSDSDCHRSLEPPKLNNLAKNIINRQLFGKFARSPKGKTEKLFHNIHPKCRIELSSLIKEREALNHIYMGFTLCGQYFVSFTEKVHDSLDSGSLNYIISCEYELHLWRFVHGVPLKLVSKHKIFKQLGGTGNLDKILFMQFPDDPFKLICYGSVETNPAMVYITILTLPAPKSCKHCPENILLDNDTIKLGWCEKHGFILHYVFSMTQPCPSFDPKISLAYPDHLVINTGHYIHILNVNSLQPPKSCNTCPEEVKITINTPCAFSDNVSELSESPSEHFETSNIVDAIIEDFSEYDLESNDCNKPFHELNISCEPLNVTGKSYHNTLVQNIVDPRFKRLQNSKDDCLFSVPLPQNSVSQKSAEKSKINKKTAEKAYEFIEENEKCEKLSLFRKKRLAEKKYEFSEDNSENIVPFNSLRKERRFVCRSQARCVRSDFNTIYFSTRNSVMRSPIQSPNSRCGQFSPSGSRHIYSSSVKNSPHHSRSPISPKESTRKFCVYSPSLDSDCSDSDSRLILRFTSNFSASQRYENRFNPSNGLLVVDSKNDTPKWIKRLVRRYSNGDFENSSLVSGQSRDDYNIPIEIPLLVQTLNEQHLDVVPDFQVDQVTQMQLLVTQRTLDCEQFVQRQAQKLCLDAQIEFLHCEDYDIKIIFICPIDGHIICQAVIKIGALRNLGSCGKPETFTTRFLFSWNICTDNFEIIEYSKHTSKLEPWDGDPCFMRKVDIPPNNCKEVLVMDYYTSTKSSLRDYNNYYEVYLNSPNFSPLIGPSFVLAEHIVFSDSD